MSQLTFFFFFHLVIAKMITSYKFLSMQILPLQLDLIFLIGYNIPKNDSRILKAITKRHDSTYLKRYHILPKAMTLRWLIARTMKCYYILSTFSNFAAYLTLSTGTYHFSLLWYELQFNQVNVFFHATPFK